ERRRLNYEAVPHGVNFSCLVLRRLLLAQENRTIEISGGISLLNTKTGWVANLIFEHFSCVILVPLAQFRLAQYLFLFQSSRSRSRVPKKAICNTSIARHAGTADNAYGAALDSGHRGCPDATEGSDPGSPAKKLRDSVDRLQSLVR